MGRHLRIHSDFNPPQYSAKSHEPTEACSRIEEWLSLPHIPIATAAEGDFQKLSLQLETLGTAANLTTDAHLATLAIERGYVLHSTDSDSHRFPGLRWKNPLMD